MALSHLLHMVADLAVGLPPDGDEAKALEKALRDAQTQLAYLPVDEVLAIQDEWVECTDGYDPMTFRADVPDCLSEKKPVAVAGNFMYVYGDDGEQAFYWKYEKKA